MENWHINKSVSIGHLITVCIFVFSIAAYALNVNNKTEINTQKIAAKTIEMDRRFDRIDKKIDKIIDLIIKNI